MTTITARVAMRLFRLRFPVSLPVRTSCKWVIPQISAHITAKPGVYEWYAGIAKKIAESQQHIAYEDEGSVFFADTDALAQTREGNSPMMIDDNGLTIITVKKDKLLEALKRNLEKHISEFKTTRAGYEVAFVEKAEELLAAAKKGDFSKVRIELAEPLSHERDYTRVINMLTMSVDEEIKISDTQFSQYVEDEWNWTSTFKTSTAMYGRLAGRAVGATR